MPLTELRTLPYTMGSIERFAIANSLDVYMVLQRGVLPELATFWSPKPSFVVVFLERSSAT